MKGNSFFDFNWNKLIITLVLILLDVYVIAQYFNCSAREFYNCSAIIYINYINFPLYLAALLANFAEIAVVSYLSIFIFGLIEIFILYLIACGLVWLYRKIFAKIKNERGFLKDE